MLGIVNERVEGEIFYNKLNIKKLDMYWLRKEKIAIMSQEFNAFFDETVMDMILEVDPKFCENNLLEKNTINELFGSDEIFKELMHKQLKQLSGGEKQKVGFVWCLTKNADVLILDEPTVSVDLKGVEIIKKELKKQAYKKMVIMVSHDIELLKICDEVIELEMNNKNKGE